MPEDMPEHMPEDMPDRMPEDMSDRMPEDLPVRKSINVMVGTTRSKVIIIVSYLYHLSLSYLILLVNRSISRLMHISDFLVHSLDTSALALKHG
jgi:hypothetical protein